MLYCWLPSPNLHVARVLLFCNQFTKLNIFSDEEEQRDREREKGEKDCEKETIRTAGFQK